MLKYIAKKMLVTGSAGFIGSHFVKYILSKYSDVSIVSLDKLTYAGNINNLENLPDSSRHKLIVGDICDQKLVEKLLRQENIDTIVHFAAESHVDRSISGPAEFIQTNIVGTFSLLESARNIWLGEKNLCKTQCRFHHISTDEVYGMLAPNDTPFSETTAYAPNSPYSASKASSDHLVRSYFHTYNLPVTMSNCSNNYGPNQHQEKLIPTVISCCIEKKQIPVYGNGSNIRDWLYVKDHCSAIDIIVRQGKLGETYNVGGNNEINNLDLVNKICFIMDKIKPSQQSYSELIRFVTDRPGHDLRYAIDNTKIKNCLGWEPKTCFDDGLEKTIKSIITLS